MQAQYGLAADDRVLLKTPAILRRVGLRIFWTAGRTGGDVVARPDGHRDPVYLAGLIREAGVTTAHFVPSMLAVFLAERGRGRMPGAAAG